MRPRMRMLSRSLLLGSVALSLVTSPLFASQKTQATAEQSGRNSSHPLTVSMVALLANPEHYEGVHVRVFGFLHIGRDEDVALYLHRDDYDYQLTKNSFYLGLSSEQRNQFHSLNDQYVLLEGLVRSTKGFQADASGTIMSISRVEMQETGS